MTISGPLGQSSPSMVPESLSPGPTRAAANAAGQLQVIGAAAQTTISPWGDLMAKLHTLSQKDPSALRQVAGEMSQSLAVEAQKATGEVANSLKALGSQLSQVAQTGDLTALKPPRHHRTAAPIEKGGTGALLNNLLAMVDHVLGPQATSAWPSFSDLTSG